jgi:hypothetical protein
MNEIRQQGRQLAATEIQAVEAGIQGLAIEAINPALILLICPESSFSAIHSGHAEKVAHFFQTLSENQRKVLFAKLIGNGIPDGILKGTDTRGLLSRQLFETLGDPLQNFSPGSSEEHAKRGSLNRHLAAACDRRDLLPSAPPIFTGVPLISSETATESTAIGNIRKQGYTIPDAVKIYQHQNQNPNLTVEAAAA